MWNWNMWYFTCVFGTCDISHVKLCVSHVKFHMWNFTCEFGTCEFGTCDISHVNTCEIMCFTCEVSHVKFHMWNFTCEFGTCEFEYVIFHMWTHVKLCVSHVKLHMWNFTCEVSHANLEHVKHNFTCEISHVKNSHVKFHTCEIMWNFCKGEVLKTARAQRSRDVFKTEGTVFLIRSEATGK
jgi:hypothetical protein